MSDSLRPHELQHASFPVHHQLPELAQTHVHQVRDAIQPSHPRLSPSPSVFNLSQHQGLFQGVSFLHQVAKVLKNIQDWFPLGLTGLISLQSNTLKSLLQHHSSKAVILWHSAFFAIQLSHLYMSTGKTIALTAAAAAKSLQSCPTLCDPIDGSPPGSPVPGILQARRLEWVAISFSNIALTRQTFVGKVMSLLLNTLSRLVITFLSRSKRLLISWLQSPSAN